MFESSPEQTGSNEERESTFFAMMQSYEDAIFRFVYFRLRNRALALDITQDVFTKTWLYLAAGKEIEYKEAFLYRTARNALIDYFKKAKSSSLDLMMETGFDPASSKDVDAVFKHDDIATVQRMVADLDETDQQIIFLRYAEERPIEEIATLYNKSVNAMTVYIHRLIKKLRTRYEDLTN